MRCSLSGSAAELRRWCSAGKRLSRSGWWTWLEHHPGSPRLINMYGTTETTVHASFREIVDGEVDSAASPIGVPLAICGVLRAGWVVASGAGRGGR